MAVLSLLAYANDVDQDVEASSSGSYQALSCLSVALGITGVKSLINDIGINKLLTAKTALQVVRAVGSRYLGYIGIVLMVVNFVDCIEMFEEEDIAPDSEDVFEEGETQRVDSVLL